MDYNIILYVFWQFKLAVFNLSNYWLNMLNSSPLILKSTEKQMIPRSLVEVPIIVKSADYRQICMA